MEGTSCRRGRDDAVRRDLRLRSVLLWRRAGALGPVADVLGTSPDGVRHTQQRALKTIGAALAQEEQPAKRAA
jgi:hypothetical protein